MSNFESGFLGRLIKKSNRPDEIFASENIVNEKIKSIYDSVGTIFGDVSSGTEVYDGAVMIGDLISGPKHIKVSSFAVSNGDTMNGSTFNAYTGFNIANTSIIDASFNLQSINNINITGTGFINATNNFTVNFGASSHAQIGDVVKIYNSVENAGNGEGYINITRPAIIGGRGGIVNTVLLNWQTPAVHGLSNGSFGLIRHGGIQTNGDGGGLLGGERGVMEIWLSSIWSAPNADKKVFTFDGQVGNISFTDLDIRSSGNLKMQTITVIDPLRNLQNINNINLTGTAHINGTSNILILPLSSGYTQIGDSIKMYSSSENVTNGEGFINITRPGFVNGSPNNILLNWNAYSVGGIVNNSFGLIRHGGIQTNGDGGGLLGGERGVMEVWLSSVWYAPNADKKVFTFDGQIGNISFTDFDIRSSGNLRMQSVVVIDPLRNLLNINNINFTGSALITGTSNIIISPPGTHYTQIGDVVQINNQFTAPVGNVGFINVNRYPFSASDPMVPLITFGTTLVQGAANPTYGLIKTGSGRTGFPAYLGGERGIVEFWLSSGPSTYNPDRMMFAMDGAVGNESGANLNITAGNFLFMSGIKVIGPRVTGWTPFSGVSADSSTSFDNTTITLSQLAARVNALQQALTAHGIIGV